MTLTRKRSKLEISLEVLRAIDKGQDKPTRIMYITNLSWIPLKKIFESLISQGLMEETEIGRRRKYTITAKGKKVLRYFEGMTKLIQYESPRNR